MANNESLSARLEQETPLLKLETPRSSVRLRTQSVKTTIYKQEDHRTMSWKNGLGTTREIAIHPLNSDFKTDRFLWRLSYNISKLVKTMLRIHALSV
jgi:hypothetical protein